MLLLKLVYKFNFIISAYPFTFHYASIKTLDMNFAIEDNRKFTFHYASIKTIRLTPMLSMTVEFTFHYASIKTRL